MAGVSSKHVHTDDIRLEKHELCRRFNHYSELSGVCARSGAVTGDTIDHIIELQMIVKALQDDMTPRYTRDTWLKNLRTVSNSVDNLQRLSTRDNQAKNQAIRGWLKHYWPSKSATEYFGPNNKWVRQMKTAWENMRPEFERKHLGGLAQTIDDMIYGDDE